MKDSLQFIVQGVKLSMQAINEVLKRHNVNGYKREQKIWKFFRAKESDELWQIDLKSPFTVKGQKYWFLIVTDDYSRFILLSEQFDHDPTTKKLTDCLDRIGRKPYFAHPYYLQDKREGRAVHVECARGVHKVICWLAVAYFNR